MSDLRNDLPSPSTSNFDQRVRETLMTYMGRQGDPMDRGVTLRDLLESGVVELLNGAKLTTGRGALPIKSTNPVSTVPDLSPPPTPTGFKVTAGMNNIFIEHDDPLFTQGHGYLRTVLYGRVREAGAPEPVFASAVKVAEFTGTVYAFPADSATTWHLWVRWQTNDGVLSSSPAGGTNGLVATTGQDVGKLLELLDGQITSSQLHQSLSKRIDKIDGPATLAGSLAAQILAEAVARKNKDDDISRLVAQISASTDQNAAAIVEEREVRTNAIKTEAMLRQSLAAQFGNGLQQANAAIVDVSTTIASADEVLAQRITALGAKTEGDLEAAMLTEQTVRANADSALSTRVTTMQTDVLGLSNSLQEEATVRAEKDGELFAQYSVKIDQNGYVSGFGLASESVYGGPTTSQFEVRADRFAIASPSGPGVEPSTPFIVQTTPKILNGQNVPVGVYIKDAFIKNGQITNAKIGTAAIDDAKIANLSASKLSVGDGVVGGNLKSINYTNTSGWQIERTGNATFNNATVRGTVYANAGTIGGLTLTNGSIHSPGSPTPQTAVNTVTTLPAPTFKDVCVGASHTLYLGTDGSVYAAGALVGSIAVDHKGNVSTPVKLRGLSNIVSMSVGLLFSAFLDANGKVWITGPFTTGPDVALFSPAISSQIVEISAGKSFVVMRDTDGYVYHYGADRELICPNSPTVFGLARIEVDRVVRVSAGWDHVLLLDEDNTLWACGGGRQARGVPVHAYVTGNVRLKDSWRLPNRVAEHVVNIAAGYNSTWFTKEDHSVYGISDQFPINSIEVIPDGYLPSTDENPYPLSRVIDPPNPQGVFTDPIVYASKFPLDYFSPAELVYVDGKVFGNRQVRVIDLLPDTDTGYSNRADTFSAVVIGGNRVILPEELSNFNASSYGAKISVGGMGKRVSAMVMKNGGVAACGDNRDSQLGNDSAPNDGVVPYVFITRAVTQFTTTSYVDSPDDPFTGRGFNLKSDGSFMFGDVNAERLMFTNGKMTYRGSIDVKSSLNPNASRMEITDTCIKVFENGQLRVRIGYLGD